MEIIGGANNGKQCSHYCLSIIIEYRLMLPDSTLVLENIVEANHPRRVGTAELWLAMVDRRTGRLLDKSHPSVNRWVILLHQTHPFASLGKYFYE